MVSQVEVLGGGGEQCKMADGATCRPSDESSQSGERCAERLAIFPCTGNQNANSGRKP